MVDGVDEETTVRMYRADVAVLRRRQHAETVKRGRPVSGAELLHELMAAWRAEDKQETGIS